MNTSVKRSSIALIIYDKKLLLFLRDNYRSITDPNTWSLVGGEVDKGETHKQAIVREMNEEINIAPKKIRYLGRIQSQDGNLHAIFLVNPTLEEVKKIKLGNEGQKVEFFRFNEIIRLDLARNVRNYFNAYSSYLEGIINSGKATNTEKLGLTL